MSSLYPTNDMARHLDDIRDQVDQMFRSWGLPSSLRAMSGGTYPKLNIGNTPESIEILAFAPGMDPSDIRITVDKGLLTIAGERRTEVASSDEAPKTVYARERPRGNFTRAVELPQDANPDCVSAKYADGCLRISIQKHEASKPRLIEVQ
jgi:HSP20 family protein